MDAAVVTISFQDAAADFTIAAITACSSVSAPRVCAAVEAGQAGAVVVRLVGARAVIQVPSSAGKARVRELELEGTEAVRGRALGLVVAVMVAEGSEPTPPLAVAAVPTRGPARAEKRKAGPIHTAVPRRQLVVTAPREAASVTAGALAIGGVGAGPVGPRLGAAFQLSVGQPIGRHRLAYVFDIRSTRGEASSGTTVNWTNVALLLRFELPSELLTGFLGMGGIAEHVNLSAGGDRAGRWVFGAIAEGGVRLTQPLVTPVLLFSAGLSAPTELRIAGQSIGRVGALAVSGGLGVSVALERLAGNPSR